MEIIHERLSTICITSGLRDFIRDVKKEKTYDQFIRILIKNAENPPTDSQDKQTTSFKMGAVR